MKTANSSYDLMFGGKGSFSNPEHQQPGPCSGADTNCLGRAREQVSTSLNLEAPEQLEENEARRGGICVARVAHHSSWHGQV